MRIASVMVVLTIWLGACGEALAQAGSIPPAGTKQGWERQHLGDHVSEPGEALPDFLRRTGRVLHDYTRQSGNEACGAIASDGQRFSLRLYTDGVPHGCVIRTSEVMEGSAFTGETIHSHPWQKVLTMTPAARAWSHFYKDGNAGAPTLRNDGAVGFSKADRANGDGWLIAGGQLLHLVNGKTERLGPVALSTE
ncbi:MULTISPECIES: hypothetical protein [Stenotrophomonas]|uniref:hypothetical protein n=1 Tax=Stenotrophomonas TaxID=40323 RepID=UPI00018FF109|nr:MULTISPECIES: hypothetical protein [Stenotrophomonas]OMP38269.1 hypothetical protein BMR86_19040 [Stenotrophomonas sp. KAs 5-3]AIL06806.1 hypothetical protein DP16_1988 [Stenotrophomonas maltophilia]EED37218.1 hypothetical protein SSKA14_224 [Stenotrophomonas sp. SKA14]ELN2585212.1 hypothetical protein [Stenotrophomonas maltophilia]ELN2587491.1 hypothetical protein [Stenotrophomonas maltophilia]